METELGPKIDPAVKKLLVDMGASDTISEEDWEKIVGFIEESVSPKVNELKDVFDSMNKGIIENEIDKIATEIRGKRKDDIAFEVYMSGVNFELRGMEIGVGRYGEIIDEMSTRWLMT